MSATPLRPEDRLITAEWEAAKRATREAAMNTIVRYGEDECALAMLRSEVKRAQRDIDETSRRLCAHDEERGRILRNRQQCQEVLSNLQATVAKLEQLGRERS